MQQTFTAENRLDDEGRPAGGFVRLDAGDAGTPALYVRWQDGPLAVDGVRREPNGAFVETVIAAAKQRIEHYQSTQFASLYNEAAIGYLDAALAALHARTADREARGVEGTHQQ
jgi:hypothetical protein